MTSDSPLPPADWYPDPTAAGQLRYWDGGGWTEHVAPGAGPVAAESLEVSVAAPVMVTDRRNVYGNDMLYLTLGDAKVGRINLGSGKVTMDQPELRADFDRTVGAWRATKGEATLVTEFTESTVSGDPAVPQESTADSKAVANPVVDAGDAAEAPEVEWRDLSENRAGQAVRAKSVELKQAAPVKTFVARALGVHTEERAWRVGADGEQEVAWRLRKLGEGWHILHSVPVGEKGSDIDHVVIGPPGVFTLNTKNHSRNKVWVAEQSFMVNGHKTDYLRNSRHEAKRASKLLTAVCGFDLAAEPIIVVMAADLTIKAQPPDVHVVGRKSIGRWLPRRPPLLSPEVVEAIFDQARRDTTWRATR